MKPLTVSECIDIEREVGVEFGPYHRYWLLQRAPEKVRRLLELAQKHPDLVATRQGFGALDLNDANTSSFTARNTSASELNILGDSANGTTPQSYIDQFCKIPINDPRAGKVYEVTFGGIYSTTGTPTITWTPRWGSSTTVATNVTFGAGPALTTASGASNLPWLGRCVVVIRTAGLGATGGTAMADGFVVMGALAVSMGGTQATIDTTGQGAAGVGITINATWGTSSASNTYTPQIYFLRSLN